MRTVRKRVVLLLLAMALCLPIMSVRAGAANMTSVMVDGGMSHSIALASDGTVYVWGSNAQMQLALENTLTEQKVPKQVSGLSNMVSVAAGYDFSAALCYDGTVYTWGGSIQSSPTAVSGLSNIVAIAAGQSGILALDRSGNVWQWSLGGVPAQVQELSNIAAIDAGGSHYLALTFYGDVYAWGGNWNGQLGIGNMTDSTVPQKVDLHNIIDVAAGQAHSLAVAFDGTVYAWGLNSYGQLGDGTITNSNVPVQVKIIKNAVQVSAGNDTSMARTEDGKLYTWGYGEYGQLGRNNAPFYQNSPQAIPNLSNQPAFIACGVYHNLYISQNGSLYAWGRNRNHQLGIQQNNNLETPKIVNNVKTIIEDYKTNALNSASSWALAELETLYNKNLISPIIWQNFQGNITRAEFIHMLVTVYEQIKNTTASTRSTNFKDINGHLFETDIIKAYNLGITSGTSATTFSPDNPLTRQEAAKMLCTFLTKMNRGITIPQRVTSMTYYTDVASIADWAAPYVAYAYNENIMRGSGTTFNPNSYLSREQGLLIVGRVIEKYQWG